MTENECDCHSLTVALWEAGERLDRFLAGHIAGLSRSRLKDLIKAGRARLGGTVIEAPNHRVKAGDRIEIFIPPPEPAVPKPEAITLDVVYEDEAVIVVDKPAGLVVHPAAGHWHGTLVNALIAHCGASLSGIGGVRRPGIVHRLDKDTSGLLVVAKTDAAHRALSSQFAAHGRDGKLVRAYLALVWGVPGRPKGTIDLALARHAQNRTKMAVVRDGGRTAVTHFEVLERFDAGRTPAVASLVKCRLETGRTHQIRVHMAAIGHPILGDAVYGAGFAASAGCLGGAARSSLQTLARQALHAAKLGFRHPLSGAAMHFERPPPADMARLIEELRRGSVGRGATT